MYSSYYYCCPVQMEASLFESHRLKYSNVLVEVLTPKEEVCSQFQHKFK